MITRFISPLVHVVAAMVPVAWFIALFDTVPDVGLIACCAVVGLLPDIDSGQSLLGRAVPFISRFLENKFGHRTVTHSAIALIIFGAAMRYFLPIIDANLLTAAYASHLIVDMVVGNYGVPLAWPARWYFYLLNVRARSGGEIAVLCAFVLFCAVPFMWDVERVFQQLNLATWLVRPDDFDGDELQGVVVTVKDGDTFVFRDARGREQTIRMIGVDTPETVHPTKGVECYGPEASAFTKTLMPPGTPVQLVLDVEPLDRYGRTLAYVYIGEIFVQEQLLLGGFAEAAHYEPNTSFRGKLDWMERYAQKEGVGMWRACAVASSN